MSTPTPPQFDTLNQPTPTDSSASSSSQTQVDHKHNHAPNAHRTRSTENRPRPPRVPDLGPGDSMGAGDSYLVAGVLPEALADVAFVKMRTEVKWDTMYHRGKLHSVVRWV